MDLIVLEVIYVIFTAWIAAYLTSKSKTEHKLITFLLSFYILGASIINESTFTIKLGNVGADLQVRRILFLVLTTYLLFISLIKFHNAQRSREKIRYEKYLYLFSVWFIGIIIYHYFGGLIKFKELGSLIQGTLSIIVLYAILKYDADEEMIRVITTSMIAVAVISSLVAIVQFMAAPYFLRVGSELPAFGGKLRSNGVYWSEYLHSYNVLFGLLLVLLFVPSKSKRFFLIGLFLIGIFFTFHRMSWITAFLCISLYFGVVKKREVWKFIIIGGILVFTIFVLMTEIFTVGQEIERSEMYQSRLKSDTMSGRLKFYNMVLENYDKIVVAGVGSKASPLYYFGMMGVGVGEEWARGETGGIHNGFLHVLFFYGMPTLVLYILMLIVVMREFIRQYIKFHQPLFFSFLFVLIYCLMNLTNAFPITEDFGFLLGIIIGCSAAVSTKSLFSNNQMV